MSSDAISQTTRAPAYAVENPNMELSPFTGMTRRHWLDAAKYLTEGVFQHVNSIDDPIALPKQNKISYPQPTDPKHRFQAAEFEGAIRTLMAAGPVLMDERTRR